MTTEEELEWQTIVHNILSIKDLQYENSLLKACLKYRKACLTCSKEIADKLSRIASNLGLTFTIINIGNLKYKFVVEKSNNL